MDDPKTKKIPKFESYQPQHQPIDKLKGGRRKKIDAWLRKHPIPALIGVALLGLTITGVMVNRFQSLQFGDPLAFTPGKPTAQKVYSPLTGAETTEADAARPITGTMIENSPDSRPQSGLKEAGVVFESVTEGGITRFLLLHQESKPDTIGPVRSVRPQFASWVAAFDAGLAHVGGSDIPLAKLRSGQIKDLDQFFNPGAYTRASNRAAPHNVYTSDSKLQALNASKGYTSSRFTSWKRVKKEIPAAQPNARSITIPVSTGLFTPAYTWDPVTNSYPRSQAGAPHLDREHGQVVAKVVVAIQVPHDVIRDSNGYRYPDVNTSGKGWVFQNGSVAEVSWSKADDKAQIEFKDSAGNSFEFNRGQMWITAIRPDRTPAWQ